MKILHIYFYQAYFFIIFPQVIHKVFTMIGYYQEDKGTFDIQP